VLLKMLFRRRDELHSNEFVAISSELGISEELSLQPLPTLLES
jgi:hypothetical protein